MAKKGAKALDEIVFNGEYYEQKVTYTGLRDTSFAEHISKVNESSGEVDKLLKKEGPQISIWKRVFIRWESLVPGWRKSMG